MIYELTPAAPKEDETKDEKTNHHEDFQTCEPELCLSIELNRQKVEADNHHDEHSNPDCNVDVRRPIVDD
jgi:hypothetical protein